MPRTRHSLEAGACRLLPLVLLAGACADHFEEPATRVAPLIDGPAVAAAYPAVGQVVLDLSPLVATAHCTGTLIGRTTVLTARHCVAIPAGDEDMMAEPDQVRIRLCVSSTVPCGAYEDYDVVDIAVPPPAPGDALAEVPPSLLEGLPRNDVALIRLARAPATSAAPQPLCAKQARIDDPVRVVGYGIGNGGPTREKATTDLRVTSIGPVSYDLAGGSLCISDSGAPVLRRAPKECVHAVVSRPREVSGYCHGDVVVTRVDPRSDPDDMASDIHTWIHCVMRNQLGDAPHGEPAESDVACD